LEQYQHESQLDGEDYEEDPVKVSDNGDYVE